MENRILEEVDIHHIFDTQTLFSVYTLVQLLFALLFFLAITVYKKKFLRTIAIGLIIEASSAFILILTNALGNSILLFISNMFGIAGPLLITEGILNMQGRSIPKTLRRLYLLLGTVAFTLFILIIPNGDYRIITFFVFTITSVVALVILQPYRSGGQRAYHHFLILIHILYLYPLGYRIYYTLTSGEADSFFQQSLHLHSQLLYLISFVILRGTLILMITAGQLELALEDANRELKKLTMTDPLTSLDNKRAVQLKLEEELLRHHRNSMPLTLAILDLDNFKSINDTYGHVFGDAVLKTFAGTATDILRDMDIIGRFGGEEFVIIMPETDSRQARMPLERIMERLRAVTWEHEGLVVTFSTGLVEVSGDDTETGAEPLVDRADRALYRAKRDGKDRIVVYREQADSAGLSG